VTLKIQIWSYNYDPEPQGIAPLSREVAVELERRGHDVLVVAAHPHYPQPIWGQSSPPHRERRDGVSVLRLPLWIGRDTGFQRVRQEASFAIAQSLVAPLLPSADVVVSVSPCLPALAPALPFARLRKAAWVIWCQDIVTDGAETTGLLSDGKALEVARGFETCAFKAADRVVVVSDAFRRKLIGRGVDADKVVRIFNPSSRQVVDPVGWRRPAGNPRILVMGNIGHSQGLDRVVAAFEKSAALGDLGAQLNIVGHGVAAAEVRAVAHGPNVHFPGVLQGPALEPELRSASIGLVSQRPDIEEFNLPSKLMTYMACGIPVIASVHPDSETARIVRDSDCGWVTNAARPEEFASVAATKLQDTDGLRRAGAAGFRFAGENFSPQAVADRFEQVFAQVRPTFIPSA
jgi:colanic acid biosynthesis glycosyl transferase WcaI